MLVSTEAAVIQDRRIDLWKINGKRVSMDKAYHTRVVTILLSIQVDSPKVKKKTLWFEICFFYFKYPFHVSFK